MLNPPTHNRPFADKRDKVGMDGVPKKDSNLKISQERHYRVLAVYSAKKLYIVYPVKYILAYTIET